MSLLLDPWRGASPSRMAQVQSGSFRTPISEFGDGTIGPVVGQRSGFIAPFPCTLENFRIWSTASNTSGDVEPAAVTCELRGWWKPWGGSSWTIVTNSAGPELVAESEQTGNPASLSWTKLVLSQWDQWEWELVAFTGLGTKLYLAQPLKLA